jgi:hypothetical protein
LPQGVIKLGSSSFTLEKSPLLSHGSAAKPENRQQSEKV